MGLIDRFFGNSVRASRPTESNAMEDLFDKLLTGGFNSTLYFADGTAVRGSATSLSTAYRCISLLSSAIASTPLNVKDATGNIVETRRPDRLPGTEHDGRHSARIYARLFKHGYPDGRLDRFRFLEQMAVDLINRGNVFLLPSVDLMHGARLEILRPTLQGTETSYVNTLPLDTPHWEVYDLLGRRRHVNHRDLIHISLPVMGVEVSDGRLPLGMPMARVVQDAVAGGKAGDHFIIEAVAAANRRGLKLETPSQLDSQEEIDKYYRFGNRSKGNARIILTDAGANWDTMPGPHEMLKAVSEARELQINDVARAYGIPAPLVNQSSSAWAAGVEQLARVYLRFSVRPFWWKRISEALTAALLPEGFEFDFSDADFLRGDWKAWGALAQAATQSGALSVEELREAGGFPPEFPADGTNIKTPYDAKYGDGMPRE